MDARVSFGDPAWLGDLKAAAASSHAFILHLNVQDYAVPGVRLAEYLGKKFASRDVVVMMPEWLAKEKEVI